MNYENYAVYQLPPLYGRERESFYKNEIRSSENISINDFYRTPFLFMQDHKKNYKNMAQTAMKGLQEDSELSKLFFSDKNMARIQKKIKEEIFKRTKGQFRLDVDQDQQDLLLAMRSVYLDHARFLPGQTIRQVKRLNDRVIEETVPPMITEIKQYYGYLKEINKPLSPIARPINVSNAGRNLLPSITTTFGVD